MSLKPKSNDTFRITGILLWNGSHFYELLQTDTTAASENDLLGNITSKKIIKCAELWSKKLGRFWADISCKYVMNARVA